MSPAKKKSSGNVVLTGTSATVTYGLPDSDETFTLERGVPTEVPSAFADAVNEDDNVYAEGSVPEDAIVGMPVVDESEPDFGGNTLPPDEPPAEDAQASDESG